MDSKWPVGICFFINSYQAAAKFWSLWVFGSCSGESGVNPPHCGAEKVGGAQVMCAPRWQVVRAVGWESGKMGFRVGEIISSLEHQGRLLGGDGLCLGLRG